MKYKGDAKNIWKLNFLSKKENKHGTRKLIRGGKAHDGSIRLPFSKTVTVKVQPKVQLNGLVQSTILLHKSK